jgi:ribosomal protein S18 acetylase RimI-like enzyme
MFTHPDARGQGIAQALIERFFKDGSEKAKSLGKDLVCSIVVDADNPAAKKLYEKCGFVTLSEEPYFPGSPRVVVLMKWDSKCRKEAVA